MIDRDMGNAPLWDNIYRGDHWDLVHAYNTSWLGWLVLVLRRHVEAIADLSPGEAQELGALLQLVSGALKKQTGCSKTYVMQFAESASHPHVHFHVVPRMPEQAPEDISYKVLRHLGVPLRERPSEDDLNAFARGMRGHLTEPQE
ncbi:MAG: HIT family protein [Chloroflexi bacterium]|nr:HIT family protein [Chloroflexota bacterium]